MAWCNPCVFYHLTVLVVIELAKTGSSGCIEQAAFFVRKQCYKVI